MSQQNSNNYKHQKQFLIEPGCLPCEAAHKEEMCVSGRVSPGVSSPFLPESATGVAGGTEL